MRQETKTINIYKFDELTNKTKEKILNEFRKYQDSNWSDFVIEDCKMVGQLLGIKIDKIYWSGFGSQGDGACFDGNYEYEPLGTKRLELLNDIKDERITQIADRLLNLQRDNDFQLCAEVEHKGYYYNSGNTDINCFSNIGDYNYILKENVELELKELLRMFMTWIYIQLEKAYDYEQSDGNTIDLINANDYEFTENGEIYNGSNE